MRATGTGPERMSVVGFLHAAGRGLTALGTVSRGSMRVSYCVLLNVLAVWGLIDLLARLCGEQ